MISCNKQIQQITNENVNQSLLYFYNDFFHPIDLIIYEKNNESKKIKKKKIKKKKKKTQYNTLSISDIPNTQSYYDKDYLENYKNTPIIRKSYR